jgi:hypothetical protein
VLSSDHGQLLLDPPGALTALPEADIAQICCQVGGVDGTQELLTLISEQHPELDPTALAGFAGLNLLVGTGYLLAEHDNPDVEPATAAETRRSPTRTSFNEAGREEAERHLRIAEELLSEYHRP